MLEEYEGKVWYILAQFLSRHLLLATRKERILGQLGSWPEPGRVFCMFLCHALGSTWSSRSLTLHQLIAFLLVQFPIMHRIAYWYKDTTYSPYNACSKAVELSVIWFPTLTQEVTFNSILLGIIHISLFHFFWLRGIIHLLWKN